MNQMRIALALVGVLTLVFGMTACSRFGSRSHDGGYTAGDAALRDTIKKIDIEWTSGKVHLVTHTGSEVLLEEAASMVLPEDRQVHWRLDGSTLRVKFCAPGVRLGLFDYGEKELTVTIPETLRLEDVSVNAASADVAADGLMADALAVKTASGGIDISCGAETVELSSASGNVTLRQTGTAESTQIHTSSGRIDFRAERCERAALRSSSGAIETTVEEVSRLLAKTTSGSVSCRVEETVEKCELESASGSVTLTLPEELGFTAEVRCTSGDFRSGLALRQNGRTYVRGGGSAEVFVRTTSGNVEIR